jgi:uncharacterized C2H2 Zn-finger protein
MTPPKLKCPECSKLFTTVQLLSMHRRQAHGIVGMSKSAIAERERKARLESPAPPPPTTDNFPCDRCSQIFTTKNGLAKHQSKKHGIVGQSKSAQDRHRAKLKAAPPPPPPTEYPCPDCGFKAKSKAGLSIHIGTTHKRSNALAPAHENYATLSPQNGSSHQEQPHRDGIPETTLALALGRWQGFAQSMAAEFDLPPKRFAAQLAQLIYATAIR